MRLEQKLRNIIRVIKKPKPAPVIKPKRKIWPWFAIGLPLLVAGVVATVSLINSRTSDTPYLRDRIDYSQSSPSGSYQTPKVNFPIPDKERAALEDIMKGSTNYSVEGGLEFLKGSGSITFRNGHVYYLWLPEVIGLSYLSSSVEDLEYIQILRISGNNITSLPSSIGNLGNLRELEAYNNQINSVPTSIGKLGRLEELDLSRNKLKSIPEEIGNLSNLTHLRLSQNKLRSLPRSILNLRKLIFFDGTYNLWPIPYPLIEKLKERPHELIIYDG